MRLPEYDRLDAVALGDLVARREVSASELLEAALERADARNPALNAIVARYDDEARARAAGPLPAGPLSGVPFLVKDLLAAWKGHPLTGSCRLLEGRPADDDGVVVHRLQRAGLVLFGQTNTPELGIMATTEPAMRGPTRNPWDRTRSSGGSSGGSAAAIAARIVPAAHGNDTGGSLRIPASACGIFGLKPTRGRIPLAPRYGENASGLTVEGVMTRSVRDTAALLDALAGPAPGDPYVAPPPARPFSAEVGAPPGRLRVAVTTRSLFGRTTDPECREAALDAARLLTSLGHEVVEAHPPLPRDPLVYAYLVATAAAIAADVAEAARLAGRRAGPDVLEAETWALAAAGDLLTAKDLVLAEQEMQRAARATADFFESHDLLLTPTLAQPPVPLGALGSSRLERAGIRLVARARSRALLERMFSGIGGRSFEATGFTMPFNQTGQPAASLPLRWTTGGLPIGVQLVARFGDEALLLRVASQLEQARPWADRLPDIISQPPQPRR